MRLLYAIHNPLTAASPFPSAGFLSVLSGTWDPSLLCVMGAALLVVVPSFQWVLRQTSTPVCAPCYELPTKTGVDADLVIGSLVFGIGWGECCVAVWLNGSFAGSVVHFEQQQLGRCPFLHGLTLIF